MPLDIGKRSLRQRSAATRSDRRQNAASRFGRDESGVTAVEMAMVAGPFLFGLLAIFEVALTFIGGQTLQMAVDNVTRQIRTGEVRETALETRAGVIDAICREAVVLYDCQARLQVDIREYPTFQEIRDVEPVKADGTYIDDMRFTVGESSSIIVARAFYKREPIAPMFNDAPAVLPDGSVMLSAALVFQNEPF